MNTDLKQFLNRTGRDLVNPTGTATVLIDLDCRTVDEARLNQLRGLGVTVNEVTKNVVTGTIDAAGIERLRKADGVRDVELSVPLHHHRQS